MREARIRLVVDKDSRLPGSISANHASPDALDFVSDWLKQNLNRQPDSKDAGRGQPQRLKGARVDSKKDETREVVKPTIPLCHPSRLFVVHNSSKGVRVGDSRRFRAVQSVPRETYIPNEILYLM